MKYLNKMSIRSKMIFLTMTVCTLALILAGIIFVGFEQVTMRKNVLKNLNFHNEILAENMALTLAEKDNENADEILEGNAAYDDIDAVIVWDKDGKIFAYYAKEGSVYQEEIANMSAAKLESRTDLIMTRQPIFLNGKKIGSAALIANQARFKEKIQYNAVTVVSILVLSIIVAFLLSSMLQRIITRPILSLSSIARKISRDRDYSVRAPLVTHDEVGELTIRFNDMIQQVQERDEELATHRERLEELVEQRTKELRQKTKELEQRKLDLEMAQDASLNIMEDLDRRRKEVEEREMQLKETQNMLIQAGKLTAIGQLGAGIAHELNQPLAAIRGYSQLILDDLKADDQVKEDLLRIEEQTGRMSKIINNIRTFSRESKSEFAKVDLNRIISDAFMLLKAQLKNHDIEVKIDSQAKLPSVWADSNQIQQVFINLIANARDALEGQKNGKISVKSFYDDDYVSISFTNNGPPIQESIMERIFDPFFTTKGPGKGTGLGLSISYGIIRDHNGEIRVRPGPENGVEFIIMLPVIKDGVARIGEQLNENSTKSTCS